MVERYRNRTHSKTRKRKYRKNTHRRKTMRGGGRIALLTKPSKKYPKGMLHAFNQRKMKKNVNSLSEMFSRSTLLGPATSTAHKTATATKKVKKKKKTPTPKKVDELTKLASKLKIKQTESY